MCTIIFKVLIFGLSAPRRVKQCMHRHYVYTYLEIKYYLYLLIIIFILHFKTKNYLINIAISYMYKIVKSLDKANLIIKFKNINTCLPLLVNLWNYSLISRSKDWILYVGTHNLMFINIIIKIIYFLPDLYEKRYFCFIIQHVDIFFQKYG